MKVTRKQVIEEKWYRGDLKWKLHSAQKIIDRTFSESKEKLFVGNCSRQFGKTFWAVTKAIETAIRIPKAQIRYGAAFQSDLLDFIIPAFHKVLEDCPASIKGKYKSSGSSFHFPNESRIKLVGLDKNPNGLRGNTLDLIILDECGFISNLDYVYKSVILPATTHRPNAKIVLISTPPATPAHSFTDYCRRAELAGSYAKFTVHDNPMLAMEAVTELITECGGIDSTTWQREYLCEFVTDSNSVIIPEFRDEYVTEMEKDSFYSFYHKYTAMDLGVRDLTAALFGYYHFTKGKLVIEREYDINGPQLTTPALAQEITRIERELWGEKKPTLRISDNNNPLLLQDLASLHGVSFIPTGKDSLHEMVNRVRIMVGAGDILIHPSCKKLIACLKYGVFDSKREGFARTKELGHYDHLAALVYLVRNIDRHSNPIPREITFNPYNSFNPTHGNTGANHGNASVIRSLFRIPT